MNKPGRTYNLILFKQSLRYQTRVTTICVICLGKHICLHICDKLHRAPAFSYKSMSKYHNQKTTVKGRTFDSKKEAERFLVLFERLNNGEIEKLATQVSFVLIPGYTNARGEKIKPLKYVADFCYYENGNFIVEDVKGYRTDVYKIKKKLFEYKYREEGLTITEI